MRSIVAALIPVTVVTGALSGCRVTTEYVPRTPGKATIGVDRGAVGVYKNGVFAKLGAPVSKMIGCSAPAVTAATEAAAQEAKARFHAAISGIGSGLWLLFPPLLGVGLGFGALSAREREASFAFTVDAVNMHNDTTACIGSSTPAAGVRP
jgi:hypothetical protein